MLPGEPAPKLALAATLELIQQRMGISGSALLEPSMARAATRLDNDLSKLPQVITDSLSGDWASSELTPEIIRFNALRLYSVVWLANSSTVSSAFGLARQLTAEGLYELAIAQLDRVPTQSRHQRMAA